MLSDGHWNSAWLRLFPLGFACFRLAGFSLFPFGRELVPVEFTGEKKVAGSGCFNGLWFLLFGAWIATTCLLAGIIYCVTIVLIPFGVGCFKLAGAAIFPIGKRIVSVEEANRVR